MNDKWSMMALLGVGWFTSDLNKISGKTILGQGGVLFVRHAKPNLDWGVGAALNNVLGYPMLFPSFYLDWRMEGRYQLKLSFYDSFMVSASMKMNNYFTLGLVTEATGMSALVEKNGKKQIFVNQYAYAGIQPEFIVGKSLSIPITLGVSFSRDVYFKDRTIKAIFDDNKTISFNEDGFLEIETTKYPGFGVSPYCSVGLKYGF